MTEQKKQIVTPFYLATVEYTSPNTIQIWALRKEESSSNLGKLELVDTRKEYFTPKTLCAHDGGIYFAGKLRGGVDRQPIFKVGSPNPIATRDDSITALCSHNNVLYDSTDRGEIFETLEDTIGENPIVTRKKQNPAFSDSDRDNIVALITHNGKLYDVTNSYIYNTLDDLHGKHPVAESGYDVICSHDGELYGASCHQLFNILRDPKGTNPLVKTHVGGIEALCSHDGILYDAEGNKIFDTLNDPLRKNLITERPHQVIGLVSHKGILYDISHVSIIENGNYLTEVHTTLDNKLIGFFPPDKDLTLTIEAIASSTD